MITFLYPRNRSAVILDNHFNVFKTFQVSVPDHDLDNMHDLHFVDNGTRALFFYDEVKNLTKAQSEAVGFTDGRCKVRENSFRELDLATDEIRFSWSSSDHISLNESNYFERPLFSRCTHTEKVSGHDL